MWELGRVSSKFIECVAGGISNGMFNSIIAICDNMGFVGEQI